MDYKKIIEKWLLEYEDIKLNVAADEILLNETRNNCGNGIDTSRESTGKTNKFNSEVENTVLAIRSIEDRLYKNSKKIKTIEEALSKIGYTERRILELRYFKKKKWHSICREMNYEYSWCQELRGRGILQIIKVLFPETTDKSA